MCARMKSLIFFMFGIISESCMLINVLPLSQIYFSLIFTNRTQILCYWSHYTDISQNLSFFISPITKRGNSLSEKTFNNLKRADYCEETKIQYVFKCNSINWIPEEADWWMTDERSVTPVWKIGEMMIYQGRMSVGPSQAFNKSRTWIK